MPITEERKLAVVESLFIAELNGEDVRKRLWDVLREVFGSEVDEFTLAQAAKEMHAKIRASVDRLPPL